MPTRLLERHGLLVGLGAHGAAVRRAALLRGRLTWSNAGINLALVFGLTPFYRPGRKTDRAPLLLRRPGAVLRGPTSGDPSVWPGARA